MRILCVTCQYRSPEEEWIELKDGARCPVCGDFNEEDDIEENYGY